MLKSLVLAVAAAVLTLALFVPAKALAGGGSTLRLEARLSSPASPLKGKAKYEEIDRAGGVLRQKFDIEVQNGVPGAVLEVTINGSLLTTITVNDLGIGEFSAEVGGDDPDDAVDSFPRLQSGDTVSVGGATGRLTVR